VYADPNDSEDRTFPTWLIAIAFLGGIGLMIVFSSAKPLDPPEPPGPLVGCYSTAGGPDLIVDRSSVTVLQNPPFKISSSLEYVKGWALETDRWLNFHQTPQGTILLDPGSTNGQILKISSEGEFASSIPSFELIDDRSNLSIRYTRSGSECRATEANSLRR
jgi:hypothetical protein